MDGKSNASPERSSIPNRFSVRTYDGSVLIKERFFDDPIKANDTYRKLLAMSPSKYTITFTAE